MCLAADGKPFLQMENQLRFCVVLLSSTKDCFHLARL